MKIEIKTIFGEVLFSGDFASVAEAVESALRKNKSLRYADLGSANLSSANLSSANLSSANLSSANLSSAELSYAKNSALAIAMTRILPEGDIIGYKKLPGEIIAKLSIPADAQRSHAFGRKCCASGIHFFTTREEAEAYVL